MAFTVEMITFDTADARALAAWWAAQLGGTVRDDHDGWYVMVVPPEGGPWLGFQKVTHPTPGKNRVHIDLRPQDPAGAIERLVSNGATFVAEHEAGPVAWTVLADPDGNQFCVGRG
ncbi:VOC family protein [Cellulomonas sp. URHE0023]|uniref:VOC family protein n=1 Tax=Cellulomonas sp. URHE0023 TaxID=1380354 RepID=UPI0004850091|nr:VOC family protein [Cellulomonas sp. URHE0023]